MAKAQDKKTLFIPALQQQEVIVKLTGLTPLLVNKFSDRQMEILLSSQTGKGKIKKEARNPEREFQEARYLVDGIDCFPSTGIKLSSVSAGYRFAGETSTELLGAFVIPKMWVPIEGSKVSDEWPRNRRDYVRLKGRIAMPVFRPEYWPWEMNIPIIFNESFISLDQIINLLRLAGTSVGIGAWRVEKKGNHGQWTISDVQQVQQQIAA